MLKKFLTIVMVCAVILSMGIIANADEMTWEYNETTKVLTIKGSGKMTSAPWNDEIDVTKVKKIVIENGVTSICDEAFVAMDDEGGIGKTYDSLTTVEIPDSVTEIGVRAFFWAENLKNVNLPKNLKKLGMVAFTGTTIESITIPATLTSWDRTVFSMCSSLESVTISDGLTKIPEFTFYGCEALTSVTIPDSVVSVEDYAFAGCSNLEWIEIPYGVVSIGSYVFEDCYSLTSVTIPPSVKILADGALFNYDLQKIVFHGTNAQWDSIKKDGDVISPDTELVCNNESLAFKAVVTGEQVDFTWNEIPNVLSYGLSIFDENDEYVTGNQINEIYGNMSFTCLLEDGKYTARLMLLTADFSGTSEFVYFNVGNTSDAYALTSLKGDVIDGKFYAEAEIVERYDRNENDMYIIASYDNGVMLDMVLVTGDLIAGTPFTFGGILDGVEDGELKAFVWDSIEGMQCLSNIVEK